MRAQVRGNSLALWCAWVMFSESDSYLESENDPPSSSEGEENEGKDESNDSKIIAQHICPFQGCGVVFAKIGKLNRHILTHTGEVFI